MPNPTGDPGKGRAGFRRNLLPAGTALALALQGPAAAPSPGVGETADFAEILATEEAILSLTPRLKKLGRDVLNLQLPHRAGAGLFADEVSFTDLAASGPPSGGELPGVAVRSSHWPLDGAERTAPPSSLRLWVPLFDRVDYFEHARFYFERGNFLDAGRQWEADIAFTGAARTRSGTLLAVAAKLATRWKTGPDSERKGSNPAPADWEDWRIERWHLKRLTTHEAADPLFTEALDRALPQEVDRKRARESIQEQLVVAWGRDLIAGTNRFEKPHVLFDISSLYQKPGVSVVDIDRDGYDDLYVMPSWGKNLLLHNQGDGTFRDIAAEVGLDLENFCSSAAFADFDNDGDPDVFMGRTFERSLYFVNEDGRFYDRSGTLALAALPNFVTSISAADYNGDGLLDVYFSTYAHDDTWDRLREVLELMPRSQARELLARRRKGHRFRDHYGPPNLLLVNRGAGRFAVALQSSQLALWRNTFQSTWADYDGDGDPDLYAANDFAPNNMLRNDGDRFSDVTAATGTADIGFGMGVSWGDYDNDGLQDLYVCNMYSKAGQRIMGQIPGLDPRIVMLAGGNSLFRNEGGRFRKVSGVEPPSLLVEKVGWAWGGQFADFDNDGFLDIYSLSGYYSAPPEIAIPEADL